MARKTTDAVAALMEEDAKRPPPPDKVDKVKQKMQRVREIELRRQELTEESNRLGTELHDIRTKELVELFDQAKIDILGIPADGNLPAYQMRVEWFYKANIGSADDPKVDDWSAAIAFIKKTDPDLLKTTFEVQFGLGEEKKRKAFEALLKKGKYDYSESFGVPWNTLTAWLKDQIVNKKRKFSSAQLKLLGATVERVAAVVKERARRTEPKKTSTAKKGN